MSDSKENKTPVKTPSDKPDKQADKNTANVSAPPADIAKTQSQAEQKKTGKKDGQTKTDQTVKPKKSIVGFVALLIAFVAIGLSAYLYQKIQQMQATVVVDDTNDDALLNDINDKLSVNDTRYADVVRRLDQLASQQSTLENLIPEPVNQTIDINEEFALAEVEHLLSIANYRLALNHDVETALAAMQSADQRLQGLRIPNVLQAREQIIADMNSIRSLNQADLSGLGLFLSDLIGRVDDLSLKKGVIIEKAEFSAPDKEDPDTNVAMRFLNLVWNELKSLVIISRDGEVSKTRMLPDEIYFLYANIKLELANARFAVFNRDTENFRASIEHIRSWLNDYFDLTDAAVGNVFDSLFRMSKIDLAFPNIDISSSIESVRALARRQSAVSGQVIPEQQEP